MTDEVKEQRRRIHAIAKTHNASWQIRLPEDLRQEFIEAAGGPGRASERLRSLMRTYIKKRASERRSSPCEELHNTP